METRPGPARILVIKHSAFGDLVLALGPFLAIRRHHAGARLVLLTTSAFEGLARATGWFDEVWIDGRPKLWRLGAWWRLLARLRGERFDRVYDLQHSDRTATMFRVMRWRRPDLEWSGIARGCSHPHANPDRDRMHTIERQAEQLAMAGIGSVPPTPLDWARGDLSGFGLAPRYALVAPGGAASRPEKRWPAEGFAEACRWLDQHGLQPVLIGGAPEAQAIATIRATCPAALDLSGRTGFGQLAELGRRATLALGNDTGPMHVFAAAGAPSLVLFSRWSIPGQTAPRGPRVEILHSPDLAGLAVAEVTEKLATVTGTSGH